MMEIDALTILQKVKPNDDFWFHHDYNINLYKGCNHGCIYCDSRSENYQITDFDKVRVKKDALLILENELSKKRNKGIIGLGAMSDPYNPFEKELNITRRTLELIEKYGFGVSIVTKSDLILRDIDILTRISKKNVCNIAITITTSNDVLQKKIEQNVTSSSRRFDVLSSLRKASIFAGILMMPILPFINDTDENLDGIIKNAIQADASYIYPFFGVTLRNIQRDYFFDKIDNLFVGIKEKYIQAFHEDYVCRSPREKELISRFKIALHKTNIISNMREINKKLIAQKPFEQMQLLL